jgi:uncharacterized membrane protein
MAEAERPLSEEEVKKLAYSTAMRLKNAGADREIIRAKLDKLGVPAEVARDVIKNLWMENNRKVVEEQKSVYNIALIRIAVACGVALVSFLIFPDYIVLPIGIIAAGIGSALMARLKIDE